jgi:hypothetical protein
LRLRVDLPVAVVELANRLVDVTGFDREVILGDLAATGLPSLIAELADNAVASPARRRLIALALSNLPPDAATAPALAEAATPNLTRSSPNAQVTRSIAPGDLTHEDTPGGTAD